MSRYFLLGTLVVLAAGPLLVPHLPAGPASLLTPSAAADGAAGAVILFLLFVWPVVVRDRSPGRVVREALEILAVSAPCVVWMADSGDASPADRLSVLGILLGVAIVTGLWLSGPGRRPDRDRWFAGAAVLVLAGLPFLNYALNEFGVTADDAGFRLSPLLVVRGILLGAPGAGAAPCLVLLVGLAALLSGLRAIRTGAVAIAVLLALAPLARAEEPEPLFGEHYVPGRPVPLRISRGGAFPSVAVVTGTDEVQVHLTDRPGRWLEVPGAVDLGNALTWESGRKSEPGPDLRPAPPGTWLVTLGAAPPELLRVAEERGFCIGRAASGAEEIADEAWLSPDGVIDVGERLGERREARLRGAGVLVIRTVDDLPATAPVVRGTRRPWEEPGRVLSPEGLADLFPAPAGFDADKARLTFFVVLGWAIVAGAIRRWGRGRPGWLWFLAVPAGLAVLGSQCVVHWTARGDDLSFLVTEGARVTEVRLLRTGRHRGQFDLRTVALPQPLSTTVSLSAEDGGYRLDPQLVPPRRTMLFVTTRFADAPAAASAPDLLIGPAGLAVPGEEWLPAGEFLRRLAARDRIRATAIRKLLPAGDLPDRVYEVAFHDGGMDVRPAR